jgi:hypothetical protein
MERGGISKLKQYPLGDDDIKKLLGSDIKIWNYPQLESLSTADQLFDGKGRAILLFPNAAPTVGHWTALMKKKGGIEFFDPYGDAPEEQKDGLSQSRLEQLNIAYPTLTNLLKASGRPVYYNTHAFQSSKPSVATCGRHAAVRLFYAPKSLEEYKAAIDSSGLSADDFVIGLTYDKIRK